MAACGKHFHQEHFFCAQCGLNFPPGQSFFEREEMPYCVNCYHSLFSMKCSTCSKAITGEYMHALNEYYHTNCFVCTTCRKPFPDGCYYIHKDKPYCEQHYYTARAEICCSCKKNILGRCLVIDDKKYHPDHFRCSKCDIQLGRIDESDNQVLLSFLNVQGKPYCLRCHISLTVPVK